MQVVQTLLTRQTETGEAKLIAWLPVKPNVRVGSIVSLKDVGDGLRWRVSAQWCEQDSSLINQKWGNDLPKSQRTER
jgi:hypothetical protein